MKHSNFNTIYSAMRQIELEECKEALRAHGGFYQFGTTDEPEKLPHAYAGRNEILVTIAIVSPKTGYIHIVGEEYYTHERVGAVEYQIEFGSFHEMMDYMSEPEN